MYLGISDFIDSYLDEPMNYYGFAGPTLKNQITVIFIRHYLILALIR